MGMKGKRKGSQDTKEENSRLQNLNRMKLEIFDDLVHAAEGAVNHLEACEGEGIIHPFKSASLPFLKAALKKVEEIKNPLSLVPKTQREKDALHAGQKAGRASLKKLVSRGCPACNGTGRRSTARSAKGSELERHERSGTPCPECGGTGKVTP